MKQLGRLAMGLCLCALCLACFSALVRQTDDAPPQEAPPCAATAAALMMQRGMLPLETQVSLPRPQSPERFAAYAGVESACLAPRTAVCCDGNGWILTGRTWPRTVYAVCPPEGMPG